MLNNRIRKSITRERAKTQACAHDVPDTTSLKVWFVAIMLCAAFALSLSSSRSHASVVFSQAPVTNNNSFNSDFATTFGLNQQADEFVLAEDATIRKIWAWGRYDGEIGVSPSDNFVVRFFADNGGNPLNTPFAEYSASALSFRSPFTTDQTGRTSFQYSFILDPGLMLVANTRYYLSIVNNTLPDNNWAWLKSGVEGQNDRWHRQGDEDANGSWGNATNTNLAFELKTVPEPSILALYSLGFGALMLARNRRRTTAVRA